MGWLSLRNGWFKFKSAGKWSIVLRGIYRIFFKSIKENWKHVKGWTWTQLGSRLFMPTQLDLETLGSWPNLLKISPKHFYRRRSWASTACMPTIYHHSRNQNPRDDMLLIKGKGSGTWHQKNRSRLWILSVILFYLTMINNFSSTC